MVSVNSGCLLFVAVDIRNTPESPVLKWGFVLLTAYTGVVDAFLYVLGCREPLPGLHERYVAVRWRQVLGSTMHCVVGDGIGILADFLPASHLVRPVFIGSTEPLNCSTVTATGDVKRLPPCEVIRSPEISGHECAFHLSPSARHL